MRSNPGMFPSFRTLALTAGFITLFLLPLLAPIRRKEPPGPASLTFKADDGIRGDIMCDDTVECYPDQSTPGSIQPACWTAPSTCPPQMRYAEGQPLLKTALVSFPGSGNTWVRHLLQMATGIYTGSVYIDPALERNGFPGEGWINGSVVAVKTHHVFGKPGANPYERALLIVRNPYDSIISYFRWVITDNHTALITDESFKGKQWKKFREMQSRRWISMCDSWLHRFQGPVHIISYERLKTNLTSELTTALKFLGWNITDEHLECVKLNSEGNFHRSTTTAHFDPYEGFNRNKLDRWVRLVKVWPKHFSVTTKT